MLHAIPNPKKNLSVDFSLDKVKTGVERISRLSNKKYKFTKSNAVFNQYTYEASEFLSLGVFIDINLSSINENKTDITIEIRRKIGTFNQPGEVTYANQHFDKIIDFISKGITMSESDLALIEIEEKNKLVDKRLKSEEEKKNNLVKYYVKKSFSFDGRIGRKEYIISLIIYAFALIVNTSVIQLLQIPVLSLMFIPLIWFILAQSTKRCHDRGNSGWYQIIPLYYLWMLFAEGDKVENEYGNPSEN